MRQVSGVPVIITITVLAFLLTSGVDESAILSLALWPFNTNFMPWQVVTYAFMHGSVMHLAFNMYGLWLFGSEIENLMGRRVFLLLYFSSILSAATMQLLVTSLTGSNIPTVGASGGVFGLLLAYGMCFPKRKLMLLFPPIPMSARVFVTVYAAIELFLGVTGTQSGVAHFAHIGGMIGGYWVVMNWRKSRENHLH